MGQTSDRSSRVTVTIGAADPTHRECWYDSRTIYNQGIEVQIVLAIENTSEHDALPLDRSDSVVNLSSSEDGSMAHMVQGSRARVHTNRMPDELLVRIRGEYREMPGLSVTAEQARRLWQLDCATCERALTTLLEEHFLQRNRKGHYVKCE